MSDPVLADRCRTVAAAAARGVDWVARVQTHSDRVRQQSLGLTEALRKAENTARRLGRAAERRMCVGVFGPSQAGKSYLVSVLARSGDQPLKARFADGVRDFLQEINPPGDRESTGLVTRFTARAAAEDPDFPVRVRLLSETDLVKILANSFLSDFNREKAVHQIPDSASLRDLLDRLDQAASGTVIAPHLDGTALYDLQEYFETYFLNTTRDLRHAGYWEAAARLAPRLPVDRRAELFGALWGDMAPFTDLYRTLTRHLERLAFGAEASLPIAALIPRATSIIDVWTLDGLGRAGADDLTVVARDEGGRELARADLPRPELTALIAELIIAMDDVPWPFLETADLLDFPGARSRLKLTDIAETTGTDKGDGQTSNPIRELFLRGKVAYLFQRYVAERELTGMMLCIPDGNQEVKDLADMVLAWIQSVQGDTPAARRDQVNTLFFVLTKFDREFARKAGEDTESMRGRWQRRLKASLYELFAKDGWPENWDGGPFANLFWLRNPAFRDRNIIDYDADGHTERGLAPAARDHIDRLRRFFLESPEVKRHFAEPERAWDAAFAFNDGGVSYLVEKLTAACTPDLKANQIGGRIDDTAARLVERLAPYHHRDADEARTRKRAAAEAALKALGPCIRERRRFGELLERLQLEDDALRGLYLAATGPAEPEPEPAPPAGDDDLFASLGLSDAPAAETPVVQDRPARFADEVLRHWSARLDRLADSDRAGRHFAVPADALRFLVDELATGARRLRLADAIAESVRRNSQFANTSWEAIAERQVRVTATLLDRFVDWLGYDRLPAEQRPGMPVARPTRPVFDDPAPFDDLPPLPATGGGPDMTYIGDWMRAFLDLAENNAAFAGAEDIPPEDNQALGDILTGLTEGRP